MSRSWDVLGDRPSPAASAERAVLNAVGLPTAPDVLLAGCAATVARYTGHSAVSLRWSDGSAHRTIRVDVDLDGTLARLVTQTRSLLERAEGLDGSDPADVDNAGDAVPTVSVGVADCPPEHSPCLLDVRVGGKIYYAASVYDGEQVGAFAGHLRRICDGLGADVSIGDLPMLSAFEIAAQTAGNASAVDLDPMTLPALIGEQVALRPDAVAAEDPVRAITYAELWRESEVAAAMLAPGTRVGLWCTRDVEMLIDMVGILRAGAAYVGLDPRYPSDRLQAIVTEAKLSAVIGRGAPSGLVARDGQRPAERDLDGARPDDLAYVMFTSGSTGRPKGVAVAHRNVVNILRHMAETPGLAACERMLSVTTPAFDLSVPDLFLPLVTGATLVFADPASVVDGRALGTVIAAADPDLMQATPATWRMLLDAGWEGSSKLRAVCGGEGYEAALVRRLSDRVAEIWNFYGPTETTVWSVSRRLDASVADPIPMGRAVRGTACFVLDERGQLVPPGVRGELHIAGAGVARGYLDRDDLTSAAFVPSIVRGVDQIPSARMYRTGDLVRVGRDGELTFAGRRDLQVKINGFRVELGEVESFFADVPGVKQAVATVHREGDVSRLICYVVGVGLDGLSLREHAARSLAPQAVPAVVEVLGELPLTRNGKVDRAALPAPRRRPGTAPEGMFEQLVVGVCERTLGLSQVFADDDLFALGASSLDISKLCIRLTEALGTDVGPSLVFQHPGIAALADALVVLVAAEEPDVLVEIESR